MKPEQSNSQLLSVDDVATYLGVSRACVYQLCRSKAIAHFRVGERRGVIRIRRSDLELYLATTFRDAGKPETAAANDEAVVNRVQRHQLKHLKLK